MGLKGMDRRNNLTITASTKHRRDACLLEGVVAIYSGVHDNNSLRSELKLERVSACNMHLRLA